MWNCYFERLLNCIMVLLCLSTHTTNCISIKWIKPLQCQIRWIDSYGCGRWIFILVRRAIKMKSRTEQCPIWYRTMFVFSINSEIKRKNWGKKNTWKTMLKICWHASKGKDKHNSTLLWNVCVCRKPDCNKFTLSSSSTNKLYKSI